MKDTIEIIDKRMKILKEQFEAIKTQVIEQKQFIINGEKAMMLSSAAYNELENIKIELLKPKEKEKKEKVKEVKEKDDEKSDNKSED